MSTFFDGLGIKPFDGLPAIPNLLQSEWDPELGRCGKVFLRHRESPAVLWIEGLCRGTAVRGRVDPLPPVVTGCFQATKKK